MSKKRSRTEPRERPNPKNLVVLVADKNTEAAVRALLGRSPALGIRAVSFDLFVHPQRDPGCLSGAVDYLRPVQQEYRHALVLFDHEGCGQEAATREELETELEQELAANGWENRSAVVVLDPELEIWVWSDSPRVDGVLGWRDHEPPLRVWLVERGFLVEGEAKPERPKEAMEEALREVRVPRSSSLCESLAEQIGLSRCIDASFAKFQEVLRSWFSSR